MWAGILGHGFHLKLKMARGLRLMRAARLLRWASLRFEVVACGPLGTGGSVDGEHGARDIG